MVTATENFRPYASPANIMAILNRVRTRNLPNPMTNDFLRISGVPETSYGRVTQALRFLNLIHEDGRPTDHLTALASATDTQYRELLEVVVREAYRNELEWVDPSEDPQSKIQDAFQRYEPRSQIGRMVTLFLGLCRESGIAVLDAPKLRQMGESKSKTTRHPSGRSSKNDRPPKKSPQDSRSSQPSQHPMPPAGMIFGVTEEDLSNLDPKDFDEVWKALGKVALARAKARQSQDPIYVSEEEAGSEDVPE